jgi:hypothetical protein
MGNAHGGEKKPQRPFKASGAFLDFPLWQELNVQDIEAFAGANNFKE